MRFCVRLEKGAQHKYLRRLQNQKPPPKYRYIYEFTDPHQLDKYEVGDKVRAKDDIVDGHYDVIGHTDDGKLHIKHDETGRELKVSQQMLRVLHQRSHWREEREEYDKKIHDAYAKGKENYEALKTAKGSKAWAIKQSAKRLAAMQMRLKQFHSPGAYGHRLIEWAARAELLGHGGDLIGVALRQLELARNPDTAVALARAADEGWALLETVRMNAEWMSSGAIEDKGSLELLRQLDRHLHHIAKVQHEWTPEEFKASVKQARTKLAKAMNSVMELMHEAEVLKANEDIEREKRTHAVVGSVNVEGVQVVVHAGDAQRARTPEVVAEIAANLRNAFTKIRGAGFGAVLRDLVVHCRQDKSLGENKKLNTQLGGWYRPEGDAASDARGDITLLASGFRGRWPEQIFMHEVGHKFFFEKLSANAREAWRQITDQHSTKITPEHVAAFKQKFLKPRIRKYTPEILEQFPKFQDQHNTPDPDTIQFEKGWMEHVNSTGTKEERIIGDYLDRCLDITQLQTKHDGAIQRPTKDLDKVLSERVMGRRFTEEFVTWYGGLDADEQFAEAFDMYVREGRNALPEWTRAFFEAIVQHRKSLVFDLTKGQIKNRPGYRLDPVKHRWVKVGQETASVPEQASAEDIADALEHMQDVADGRVLHRQDFQAETRMMSLDELAGFDDFSSWAEWKRGELAQLDAEERDEEIEHFRGAGFAERVRQWQKTGWPTIVVVETRDGHLAIADGRGRVTVAIGLNVPSLPVTYLKERVAKSLLTEHPDRQKDHAHIASVAQGRPVRATRHQGNADFGADAWLALTSQRLMELAQGAGGSEPELIWLAQRGIVPPQPEDALSRDAILAWLARYAPAAFALGAHLPGPRGETLAGPQELLALTKSLAPAPQAVSGKPVGAAQESEALLSLLRTHLNRLESAIVIARLGLGNPKASKAGLLSWGAVKAQILANVSALCSEPSECRVVLPAIQRMDAEAFRRMFVASLAKLRAGLCRDSRSTVDKHEALAEISKHTQVLERVRARNWNAATTIGKLKIKGDLRPARLSPKVSGIAAKSLVVLNHEALFDAWLEELAVWDANNR